MKKNEKEVISYYSAIAKKYEEKEKDNILIKTDKEKIKKYKNELQALKKWVKHLAIGGTIIDIGSGTGRLVPIWSKKASKVICIDASDEMLKISRLNNNFHNVEHFQGNFLDNKWLGNFLKQLYQINAIYLGFVLNLLTPRQEEKLLACLQSLIEPGTKMILLENQSSFFSSSGHFSRTEIQHRPSPDSSRVFKMYKRNFLPVDARRVLQIFGDVEKLFYTDNYFVGGVACAR